MALPHSAFPLCYLLSPFPRILDRAMLTCEEDVVKFVFQQLPSLLGPTQHHSKAALQGMKTAQEADPGQEDIPTSQDRGGGCQLPDRQNRAHLVQILG